VLVVAVVPQPEAHTLKVYPKMGQVELTSARQNYCSSDLMFLKLLNICEKLFPFYFREVPMTSDELRFVIEKIIRLANIF